MSVIADAVRMKRDRRKMSDTPARRKTTLNAIHELKRPDIKKVLPGGFAGFKVRSKRFFRKAYKKLNLKHLIPLTFVALYTILGAAIFVGLERSTDQSDLDVKNKDLQTAKIDIVDKLARDVARVKISEITGRQYKQIFRDAIDDFEKQLGSITGNSFDPKTAWDFWNAMYFSGTIYTTIGRFVPCLISTTTPITDSFERKLLAI